MLIDPGNGFLPLTPSRTNDFEFPLAHVSILPMVDIPQKNAPCDSDCNSCNDWFFNSPSGALRRAFVILSAVCLLSGSSAGQGSVLPESGKEKAADGEKSTISDNAETATETTDLLDGDFLKQWQIYNSDPATQASDVWKIVRDTPDAMPVLVCRGEPKGFVFTNNQFADFELTLEWKYPKDVNGNSGILVYTQMEPRIWPTSVQVQLHQPKAGSIFPSGDATTDNERNADPDLARPVNTWNECRIISRGGRIAVEVNGKKAGEISGARPAAGRIALQSEGSEVHFRQIHIRNLIPADPSTDASPLPPDLEKPSVSQDCSFIEFRRRGRKIHQDLNRKVNIHRTHSAVVGSALTYRWSMEHANFGGCRVCSRENHGYTGVSHSQLPEMWWYREPGGRAGISPVPVLRFPDSADDRFDGSHSADGCNPGF